jgi:hypothetical protein
MITTRAVPALLSVHHWRVASKATVKNDFADPLRARVRRRAQPARHGDQAWRRAAETPSGRPGRRLSGQAHDCPALARRARPTEPAQLAGAAALFPRRAAPARPAGGAGRGSRRAVLKRPAASG